MATAQRSGERSEHGADLDEFHSHPGPKEYLRIAIILAVVTGIEVGIYYIDSLRPLIVPLLLTLSLLKFALVVLYFMHLKFDSRIFRRLFVMGIILALAVYTIVLSMFLFVGR